MLHYTVVPSSLTHKDNLVELKVKEEKTGVTFNMELYLYAEGIVRLRVKEENPLWSRYEVKDVLLEDLALESWKHVAEDDEKLVLDLGDDRTFVVDKGEFRFDYVVKGQVVISGNHRGLFYFENTRKQNEEMPPIELADNQPGAEPQDFGNAQAEDGKKTSYGISLENAWESTFSGSVDKNEKGPQSIGMDISFIGASEVYGIPEHATSFALKPTTGGEGAYSQPYRLWNLDVFEYELDEPMALYGAVPFMIGHSPNQTAAIFWMNAAETWVDVEKKSASGLFGLWGSKEGPSVDTHWRSETGIIDVFFMGGPTPNDIYRQFTGLTGRPELPPLFSLAYHQCRWNYKDEADVFDVNHQFGVHDIPYDVIWLDIEHTDGKRYFTWDSKHFPTPKVMLDNISKYGRKMVTIIDPHIKRDDNYNVYKIARDNGYFVKDENGADYDGFCWSGQSSWLDYTSPVVRDWWATRFEYQNYIGSTKDLYTWNDMNEPSVFNGPEVSMKRHSKHIDGWEHRDVHNIYGMLMQRATAEGLIKRNSGHNKRPFVLSRSFYAGSQRWGAIWTGDNAAQWSHLAVSTPMLLSMGVSGIVFAGADVGGFFGNPEPELVLRWYQAGAYQPFFRGHAHLDSKRREPWLHGETFSSLIRTAIIARYQILPYLYTLFYQAYLTGVPPMRPLLSEYPTDQKTFNMDDQYLLGAALLVKPITAAGVNKVNVYFPGEQDWYDTDTYVRLTPGEHTVEAPHEEIPVFQRGGTIVPRKMRVRRSTTQMQNDPFTFIVALTNNGTYASGELYVDDGDSYDYKSGTYVYRQLLYTSSDAKSAQLQSITLGEGKMYTRTKVEKIVVVNLKNAPSAITAIDQNGAEPRTLYFEYKDNVLTIKRPDVVISTPWTIQFTF